MRDFKIIPPKAATAAGYFSFESVRRAQVKDVRSMNADGEKYARAMGWRIVGRWDDPKAMRCEHRRTFWCERE